MKDPCQKQACAIQYCLQKNKYQEAACLREIQALKDCCRKWRKESGCCGGVKIEEDVVSNPNKKSSSVTP